MKVYNISGNHYNKMSFNAVKTKDILPQSVINHYGLNMETLVGYNGEKTFMPAPKNIRADLAEFLNRLKIDWNTHVPQNSK